MCVCVCVQRGRERETARGECYWHFANCDRLPPPWVAIAQPLNIRSPLRRVSVLSTFRGAEEATFSTPRHTDPRIEKPTERGGAGPGLR